jgi:eukaryotic translation initiation factor 2C
MQDQPVPQPSQEITKFEDNALKASKQDLGLSGLSIGERLPQRPGYSSDGKPIVLRTNYFNLQLKNKDQQLFRYKCDISGEQLSKAKKKRYIELLLQQPPFAKSVVATDYATQIYMTKKLPDSKPLAFRVILWERLEPPWPAATPNDTPQIQQARRRKTREMKVAFVQSYAVNELFNFVRSSGASFADKDNVRQALSVVLSRGANSSHNIANAGLNDMYPFGDSFVPRHPQLDFLDIGQGLLALRGYFASVRLGPQRVLVNVQPSVRAFYKPIGVVELIDEFMGRNTSDLRYRALQTFLKGVRVVTDYRGQRKICTIYGLATAPKLAANCKEVKFLWTNYANQTRMTSVADYFRQSKYCQSLLNPAVLLILG